MNCKVKTCVYAIALNEIKHVDLFMRACSGTDLVLVCDTGSTDGTAERLRELGATVYSIVQHPWRFDIPRNTALNLIPGDIDICLSIDLDEYLQPGWLEAIDTAWQSYHGLLKRISYDYIWNWKADGSPDFRFYADKIHHRNGYKWQHPCHETLKWIGQGIEVRAIVPEVTLHHRADNSKSRSQYSGLLKLAVSEAPMDDRMRHYYARELMHTGLYTEAIVQFDIHLSLPSATWNEERCASLRFKSRCLRGLGRFKESLPVAVLSTIEYPCAREPWIELCLSSAANTDAATCYWAAVKCLAISERPMTYASDSASWGADPHNYAALSAYTIGLWHAALDHGLAALALDPTNSLLISNVKLYREKLPVVDVI